MSHRNTCRLAMLAMCSLALATPAWSQPVIGKPASILIFPLLQSGGGRATLITVTNTQRDVTSCGNGVRMGDVQLQYHYLNVANGTCQEVIRRQLLTPGDTLTVDYIQHDPSGGEGWVWIEALDPVSHQAISFNFLVGSAILADGRAGFRMRYQPYGFRALTTTGETDGCGRRLTDVDRDHRADFNGVEYDYWPARLILDEFIQESGSISSELFVASADSSTSDGSTTALSFFFLSNNERIFSQSTSFDCLLHRSLRSVSNIVGVLNQVDDPNELRTSTNQSIHLGWMEVTGNDGVLGVFLQRIGTGPLAEGQTLQFAGAYGSASDPGHTPVSLGRP